MKFVLFVEGYTEQKAVHIFLKQWLDHNLERPVGIKPVRFEGWSELVKDAPTKAKMYLDNPKQKDDIIAVISLLDLYGLMLPYPSHKMTVAERYQWAKKHLEDKVHQAKFFQFFAVHETEAWLLSDHNIFPQEVRKSLPGKQPEEVNFDEPPAKLLDKLYESKFKRSYKKVVHGKELFGKLDPALAYHKCPYLKLLLDEMLRLAQDAGL